MMDRIDLNEPKRGYLKGDFAFFHLKDMKNMQFEYHYHDFNKIIIFISGSVTYLVEGKAYRLKPWDILFVNSNEVHKPIIDPAALYERMVIWVNPGFLEKHSEEYNLFTCFSLSRERNSNLLRLDHSPLKDMKLILSKLEIACRCSEFGSGILKNSLFLQLLVLLTREQLGISAGNETDDIITDENIQKLLDYINMNISKDLSINTLADKLYLSRYHLMHKFKQQTGYSVHNYILQKRLIKADTLIRAGIPTTQACEQSGFNDYSSFVRAFKKMFGLSPKHRFKK